MNQLFQNSHDSPEYLLHSFHNVLVRTYKASTCSPVLAALSVQGEQFPGQHSRQGLILMWRVVQTCGCVSTAKSMNRSSCLETIVLMVLRRCKMLNKNKLHLKPHCSFYLLTSLNNFKEVNGVLPLCLVQREQVTEHSKTV